MPSANRCPQARWRPAARPMRCCSGPSAVPPGMIRRPQRDRRTRCSSLRSSLELFANLRPVRAHESLAEASPLRPEVRRGADILIVRELTGGLYFGRPQGREESNGVTSAVDTLRYTRPEIERIVELAFALAAGRRGHLTSVDKANVLATSRLWREVVDEAAVRHPEVSGRARARRLDRLPAPDRSATLRRHRHREPVRRHPLRRGGGHQRLARASRLRFPRGASRRSTARSGCTSLSTEARRRSPGPAPPTRWQRWHRRRFCCATRSGRRRRRTPSTLRSTRQSQSGPRTTDVGGRATTDEVTAFLLERIGLTTAGAPA